jgi:Cu(I)/Ag(I) efflux system membrane fusion protein
MALVMKTILRYLKGRRLQALLLFVAGWMVGYWLSPSTPAQEPVAHEEHEHTQAQIWTCSMHPQIRQNEAGKCPLCGMDLVPAHTLDEGGQASAYAVKMTPTAMALAQVQTFKVAKGKPFKQLRLNGQVAVNEQNLATQPAHIPGRVERLLVNFTGQYVQRGQVMAYIYSPELINAQEELLQAVRLQGEASPLAQAAKEKLRSWKLSDQQIAHILAAGSVQTVFPVLANTTGYVLRKQVNVGDYVNTGQSLFEIADLSTVWILLDVYEEDLPWIQPGMRLSYHVQALPGNTFEGTVDYVDPVVDPQSRVARARVVQANPGGQLKPGMLVVAEVQAGHKQAAQSLIVPKTAVMWTGKRSLVYVMNRSQEAVYFEMREVVLGLSLGDDYEIESGLQEGEEVVVHGTFAIDAAAQLAGKPSMMNRQGSVPFSAHKHHSRTHEVAPSTTSQSVPPTLWKPLRHLLDDYDQLKNALVEDKPAVARQAAQDMLNHLKQVPMETWEEEMHRFGMPQAERIGGAAATIAKAQNIEDMRRAFLTLSDAFIAWASRLSVAEDTLYVQYCPMANNNKGGYWLSREKNIQNPYFGSNMLRCGSVKQTLTPAK